MTPQPRATTTEEKPTAADVADEKVTKPDPESDDPTFTIARLSGPEAGAFFGTIAGHQVNAGVVAGAYAGVDLGKEVTLADAKKRIGEWLKAEVEIDPALVPDENQEA